MSRDKLQAERREANIDKQLAESQRDDPEIAVQNAQHEVEHWNKKIRHHATKENFAGLREAKVKLMGAQEAAACG